MRILAIGAHYDDVEIGTAGTLLHYVTTGDEVYVAVLNSDEFRTGDMCTRRQEQLNALKIMGIPSTNLLEFKSDMADADIIGELDKVKADMVYTLYEKDTHQDHVRCSRIGTAVGRKKHITTFFYDSGSSYEFFPNVFNIINFDKKKNVFECFDSQIRCGAINLDIMKRKESYWGSLISYEPNTYAEGFISRKIRMDI